MSQKKRYLDPDQCPNCEEVGTYIGSQKTFFKETTHDDHYFCESCFHEWKVTDTHG